MSKRKNVGYLAGLSALLVTVVMAAMILIQNVEGSVPESTPAYQACAVVTIPDCDVTLPVAKGFSQEIVDQEEMGAMFEMPISDQDKITVICDHNYQGFGKMLSAKPGTRMTLTTNEGEEKEYECYAAFVAKNTSHGFQMQQKVTIHPDSIWTYTCIDDNGHVGCRLWQPAEK